MVSSTSSPKQGADSNRSISRQFFTLHQRLHHALNLGFRSNDKGRNWHCADIEMQRLVIRSIDSFLDCISSETYQHPLVKDSFVDMVRALESILLFKSESTLKFASDVALKMVNLSQISIFQSQLLDLILPLSSLLSSKQLQVAISCATALNSLLSNLSIKSEKQVWEVLKETNAVGYLIRNLLGFCCGNKPNEYFQEMALLLSRILWQWPSSRFHVLTETKLFDLLDNLKLTPEYSMKVSVLQLYTALALCGNGTKKVLENGEAILQMMIDCMNSSHITVRTEAFQLAQCLMRSERECSQILVMFCEPLVKAIITGLTSWSLQSGKLAKDQMSLVVEACRLALITRWTGGHHDWFWKLRIDKILVDFVLINFSNSDQSIQSLSIQDQVAIAREGLSANFLVSLRPYVWDILGWLATNCEEDLKPHGNEAHLSILITCACLAFADSIPLARQINKFDLADSFGYESASRAVLMMVYSPSKYIALRTRSVLSEIMTSKGMIYAEYALHSLNVKCSRNEVALLSNHQIAIYLVALACYAALPKHRKHIIKHQGLGTFLTFIRWWQKNPIHMKWSSLATHLDNPLIQKICCCPCLQDWEGEDVLVLLGLWSLAELIRHCCSTEQCADVFKNQIGSTEAQFVAELQEIFMNFSSPGIRWYAAYILSYFGYYGFPSKFGRRIGKSLSENEYADLELTLMSQESIYVHGVILMVRCPALLPREETLLKESIPQEVKLDKMLTRVRLSAHVDRYSLMKLLEYVYLGYFEASEDVLRKLKLLAKHCKLQPLMQIIYRRNPSWGSPFPSYDLRPAIGPAGHYFSDIILEADKVELSEWTCNICSVSTPHMHAHKVILWSSCEYLRALLQSGMRESHSQTIKVPVGWNSLVKLVHWFYSGELPKPVFDCLWDNMDIDDKLHEVRPYVELCSLAGFWLMDDLHEECFRFVVSGMDSCRLLSIKIIQVSANLSQWDLVGVAASYMAPLYHRLRNSGELDELDEDLAETVRAASVKLSRERTDHSG